nr:transcriptional regulator [Motilibacter deserti]
MDLVIHAPVRLRVCALLAAAESAEFAVVREEVGVSDSVLSKHVRTLEEAGYVTVSKATVSSRVRTWLALTPAGRSAFAAHVAELQRIVAGAPVG